MPVDRSKVRKAIANVDSSWNADVILTMQADAAIEAVIEGLMEPSGAAIQAIWEELKRYEQRLSGDQEAPFPPRTPVLIIQAALTAELARLKEEQRE